jgi:flagellar protein FliS
MLNQQSLMQIQQRNKYLQTSIQTATPAQLLIMLYDGAIRFCKSGIDAINNSDLQEAHRCISRAEDIITEFIITLDKDSPVAEGLIKMYDYMNFRLIEANTKKEIESIEEVIGLLKELRETWVQAAKLVYGAQQPGVSNG